MGTRRKNANGLGGVTKHKATGRYQIRVTVDGRRVTRYANTQAEGEEILTIRTERGGALPRVESDESDALRPRGAGKLPTTTTPTTRARAAT